MEERFHKRQKIYKFFYAFPLRLELIHEFFSPICRNVSSLFNTKITSSSSHTAFCILTKVQFIGPNVQQEYQIFVSRCKI